MTWRILQGDVFATLPQVEPGSIDVAVTSPPYWRLRAYLPKDHPLKHLELGQEQTPQEYVANMVRVCSLVKSALADHGTLWLNVGDSYTHAPGKRKPTDAYGAKQKTNGYEATTGSASAQGIEDGNLCLIPDRLRIALQDDGWLVRSVIVWRKPSAMPASLTGWFWHRCRAKLKAGWDSESHPQVIGASGGVATGKKIGVAEWTDCPGCRKCEKTGGLVLRRGSWRPTSSWEPIIMLAKTDRYFADGEPVKTAPAEATKSRDQYTRVLDDPDEQFAVAHDHETFCDGANARDVQEWAAEPLRQKHYAAFPSALVRWCLKAGTSEKGYCRNCGAPWARVLQKKSRPHPSPQSGGDEEIDTNGGNQAVGCASLSPEATTMGWRPTCACPNADQLHPRPARVLDPFAGSGRTGVACSQLGLDFTGCELHPDYVDMASTLLSRNDPKDLFSGAT